MHPFNPLLSTPILNDPANPALHWYRIRKINHDIFETNRKPPFNTNMRLKLSLQKFKIELKIKFPISF